MSKILIKISSNLLDPDNEFDVISYISEQISKLHRDNKIIIVTSGAVMYGMKKMGLEKRPSSIPELQSYAAIGQIALMRKYEKTFEKSGLIAAEILVSADDFKVRKRYLNLRNTVDTLLDMNTIPLFNENDSVNTEELKLGDNDQLSSLIAIMMDFDKMIILTDVDGVYTDNPKKNKSAQLLKSLNYCDTETKNCVNDTYSTYTTGGMSSKLDSAFNAANAGVEVFIGNGKNFDLNDILINKQRGTYIKASNKKYNARKKWIGFTPSSKSGIFIDRGALIALYDKKKSLLPSGVLDVHGKFDRGSLVNIFYKEIKVAQGLSNYSSEDIIEIKGKSSTEIEDIISDNFFVELVHKNNIYLTLTNIQYKELL